MSNPKVSVIMPVYNAEKYIKETIDSILKQTFVNYEFLIIDDGSSDKSLEIIRSYNDSRIKVFKNEKNIGYVQTLNKLLKLAKGEYIARQDNDDISLPKRLEKQVRYLDKNTDIGVCGSNAFIFGSKKKKTLLPISDNEIRAYMIFNNPMLHPSIMFRKSLFTENKIPYYDESLCPAEDYAMWFEISKKSKLSNLAEPLLMYRWHDNNASQLQKKGLVKNANIIRSKILKYALSYHITNRETALIELISSPRLIDYDTLISLEGLLIKILLQNKKKKYINEKTLSSLFFNLWTMVCYKNKRIKLSKKIIVYFSSKLYNHFRLLNFISLKSINKFIYDKNI